MVRIYLPPMFYGCKDVLYPRPHFGDFMVAPLLAFGQWAVAVAFPLDSTPITLPLESFFALLTGVASTQVFSVSAYRSEESAQWLKEQGNRNRMHERGYRNRPLSKAQEHANTRRSRHHARGEHVFAAIVQQGGKWVRTIGIARARVKIGMMNLVYNLRRFFCLLKQEVAW